MFLSSKFLTVSHFSIIGTVVFVPSDYVPTPDNDTFTIMNMQPSFMQGEHWIIIASFRFILHLADSLCRKKYICLKQQYE